jgi:ParB-like chromosome segregation protein Spo0J
MSDDAYSVDIAKLGERLSPLRLCEPGSVRAMRRSLEVHGQLTPLLLFADRDRLEIIDGFKRVKAARALGWRALRFYVDELDSVEAKLRLRAVHEGRGLCELEEGWLVRSLHRDDGLSQAEIAHRMRRHKSWVCRRLMLVESLDPIVQADVRLGLLAPRAALAVSRLPRGNQPAAGALVVQRALTVRQTEQLVEEMLADPDGAPALLERRLSGKEPPRAARNDAAALSADIVRVHHIAARMQTRLRSLDSFTPAAVELIRGALVELSPVLRALDASIHEVAS